MTIKVLLWNGDGLVDLPYNPEEHILSLLKKNTEDVHLIMEPGELADYAQGQKFLMDSPADIIFLNKGEQLIAPQGKVYHIFIPVKVSMVTSEIKVGYNYWREVQPIRKILSI